MKLPSMPNSGVQSLPLRSVQGEAQAASADQNLTTGIIQEVGKAGAHLELLNDQRQATAKGNQNIELSAKLNKMTSQPFIDINSPDIPDDVRNKVISDIARDGAGKDIINDDTGYHVPSYRVNQYLSESFGNQIKTNSSDMNVKQQQIYGSFVGQAVDKNIAATGVNVNTANVKAIHDQYKSRQQALVDAGQLSEAIAVGKEAEAMNIYSPEQRENHQVMAIEQSLVMADDELASLQRNAEIAKFNGDDNSTEQAKNEFNRKMDYYESLGIYDLETRNEKVRQFNQGLESEEYRGETNRHYDQSGYESAYKNLEAAEGKPPPNFTMDEWRSEVRSMKEAINTKRVNDDRLSKDAASTIKTNASIALVGSFSAARRPIVAKADVKALNEAYPAMAQQWQKQDPSGQLWEKNSIDLIARTKRMPQGFQDALATLALSDNPADQVRAGQMFNKLQYLAPEAMHQISSIEEKTKLGLLGKLTKTTNDPEKLSSIVDKMIRVDDSTKSERNSQYSREQGKLKGRAEDAINQEWPTGWKFWSSNPGTSDRFQAQYRNWEKTYFTLSGDMELASQMAAKEMKGSWGVSKVNNEDGEMTEFAMESTYGDWALPQAQEYKKSFPDKTISFSVDGLTINPETGERSYPVLHQPDPENPYWTEPVVDDRGRMVRFYPDETKTDEYKMMEESAAYDAQTGPQVEQLFNDTLAKLEEIEPTKLWGAYGHNNIYRIDRIINESIKEIENDPMFKQEKGRRGRTVKPLTDNLRRLKQDKLQALENAKSAAMKKTDSKFTDKPTVPISSGGRSRQRKTNNAGMESPLG